MTLKDSAAEEWRSILAHWDTARGAKRTRVLWRRGIPPNMRKEVWSRTFPLLETYSPAHVFEDIMHAIHTDRNARQGTGYTSETARLVSYSIAI